MTNVATIDLLDALGQTAASSCAETPMARTITRRWMASSSTGPAA